MALVRGFCGFCELKEQNGWPTWPWGWVHWVLPKLCDVAGSQLALCTVSRREGYGHQMEPALLHKAMWPSRDFPPTHQHSCLLSLKLPLLLFLYSTALPPSPFQLTQHILHLAQFQVDTPSSIDLAISFRIKTRAPGKQEMCLNKYPPCRS